MPTRGAVDDAELMRLTALAEQLLRQHHARPDRCCGTGCLHCPEARRMAWRANAPARSEAAARESGGAGGAAGSGADQAVP